jgi:hypothetical protein
LYVSTSDLFIIIGAANLPFAMSQLLALGRCGEVFFIIRAVGSRGSDDDDTGVQLEQQLFSWWCV